MSAKKTYLFFSFCILWFIASSLGVSAQPYLGAKWNSSQGEETSYSQKLDSLQLLGIQYIELQEPVDTNLLDQLQDYNFTILIRSELNYLIHQNIIAQKDEIEKKLFELHQKALQYEQVSGIGLFTNSLTKNDDVRNILESKVSTSSEESSLTLYFVNDKSWFNFENATDSFASLFDHSENDDNELHHFDAHMRELVDNNSNQILFIDSDWLLSTSKASPALSVSLIKFKESKSWLIPLPEREERNSGPNFLVILLLVLWVGLAVQVKYLPYVKPMILRYFFAHRFFVDDILHYRERMTVGSLLMMLMHAIFGGIVAYITASLLISETGLVAFFHHFPFLALAGANYASIFLITTIVLLLTQVIAVFWLYLPAKNLEHLSQTLNLYSGLFSIDFIIVTLMIPLFLTNTWPVLTYALSIIFVLIWFMSFNITAYNSSKSMGSKRVMYLLITIGLHSLITLLALILLFTNPYISESLALAASL